MKVGINGRGLEKNEPGGAIQVAQRIVKELYTKYGDEFELITFGHESLAQSFPINDHDLDSSFYPNSKSGKFIWESGILPRLVSKHKVDCLYCPLANAPLFPINTPVILEMHGLISFAGDWIPFFQRKINNYRIPPMVDNADKIITVSEYVKSEFIHYINVEDSKIEVVYNGIDVENNEPKRPDNFSVPDKYILFVGQLSEKKNFRRVLKAFKRLDKNDLELVFVGPTRGVKINQKDVVHKGFVSRMELDYLYRHSELLVFPSLHEGFGLPPIEAMARGTPVVTSNIRALPEILADAPYYVDPYNIYDIKRGIEKVLSDQGLQRKMVKKGKKVVRNYSWDESIENRIDIINSIQ